MSLVYRDAVHLTVPKRIKEGTIHTLDVGPKWKSENSLSVISTKNMQGLWPCILTKVGHDRTSSHGRHQKEQECSGSVEENSAFRVDRSLPCRSNSTQRENSKNLEKDRKFMGTDSFKMKSEK